MTKEKQNETTRERPTCYKTQVQTQRHPLEGGGGGEGEGSVRGVRVGLGHRFAAAWVRVRAAFGDG